MDTLIQYFETYMGSKEVNDPMYLLKIPFLGHRKHIEYEQPEVLAP